MMEKLAVKQPRLVKGSTPLLLHGNARPHTAQQTATKLEEVQLECLKSHPPYFPHLAPADYHFFSKYVSTLAKEKIQLRWGSANRLQRLY
jgi:[histone H3]-lysine36 N-dimethyltransferase SETMAR